MSEIIVKLPKLHNAQSQIMAESKRFNVLKCGRRFGKTELGNCLVADPLIDGKKVGYWYPNYKDGKDVWTIIKRTLHDLIAKKDEQLRQLTLVTGGVLDMWSLEDPDAGRGFKYHRAIIDEAEKARHLKQGWEQTIRATLVDYSGDAWFMSTPKFGNTYFKTDLFTNELKFDNWKSWRFTSYDNPFLPPNELDEIKATLDPLVFRCEFLAEDVDITDNPFAWAFDKEKHIAKDLSLPIWSGNKDHYLYLSFDFNKNPITCAVIQHIDMCIYVIKQYKLANSDIYQLCARIRIEFKGFLILVTGDATGQSGSAMVKDNLNYYKIIQRQLGLNTQQFKLPTINPKIEENQVLVNSILAKYPVQIHPIQADALIFDLQNVSILSDGSMKKGDRNDPKQQSDALDCFIGDTLITCKNKIKPIYQIQIGEKVLTRRGYKKVIDKWDSLAEVYEFEFTNGVIITCTKDHKFLTNSLEWIEIFTIFDKNLSLWKNQSFIMDVNSRSTQSKNIITPQLNKKRSLCIDTFGNKITERFQAAAIYIILTKINLIITLRTFNVSKVKNTIQNTVKRLQKKTRKGLKNLLKSEENLLKNGTEARMGLNGIKNMPKTSDLAKKHMEKRLANIVEKHLLSEMQPQDFATTIVNQDGEESCFVKVKSAKCIGVRKVYDITVEYEHEFIANGFVVHNCFRYYLNTYHKNFIKTEK